MVTLELMASRYTVLAPDYPPLRTIEQFDRGLSAILRAEGIGRFHLICQSYGGMLGQCYLARHPERVDRLVLPSTGPADYRRLWLPDLPVGSPDDEMADGHEIVWAAEAGALIDVHRPLLPTCGAHAGTTITPAAGPARGGPLVPAAREHRPMEMTMPAGEG